MKEHKFRIIMLLLITLRIIIFPCTKDQAIEAEKTLFRISAWEKLFEAIEKYPCDDGAIAEGFSQAVNNCVRYDVIEIQKLSLSKKHLDFIIKHVDETWSQEEAKEARDTLEKYCVPEDGSFIWTILSKLQITELDHIERKMSELKFKKCNTEILNKVAKSLENLNKALITSFFYNFGKECENNVEFREWSNELLFSVIIRKPALSIELLFGMNSNIRNTILNELKSPIHDGIDMKAAYVGLQKLKSGSIIQYEMMEAISSGFTTITDKKE